MAVFCRQQTVDLQGESSPPHRSAGYKGHSNIYLAESSSLLRHMARHFLPWSAVLDSYQLWQTGNWDSAPSPRCFPAPLLQKKKEKVSNMLLSDLSKCNPLLLSTDIANRCCNEPGKRAVLNTVSSASAFLEGRKCASATQSRATAFAAPSCTTKFSARGYQTLNRATDCCGGIHERHLGKTSP